MTTKKVHRKIIKREYQAAMGNLDWVMKHFLTIEGQMAMAAGLTVESEPLTDEQIAQLPANWQQLINSGREIAAGLMGLQLFIDQLRLQV